MRYMVSRISSPMSSLIPAPSDPVRDFWQRVLVFLRRLRHLPAEAVSESQKPGPLSLVRYDQK